MYPTWVWIFQKRHLGFTFFFSFLPCNRCGSSNGGAGWFTTTLVKAELSKQPCMDCCKDTHGYKKINPYLKPTPLLEHCIYIPYLCLNFVTQIWNSDIFLGWVCQPLFFFILLSIQIITPFCETEFDFGIHVTKWIITEQNEWITEHGLSFNSLTPSPVVCVSVQTLCP